MFWPPFDSRPPTRSALDMGRGHRGQSRHQTRLRFAEGPPPGGAVQRGHDHDGLGHTSPRSSQGPRQHRRYQEHPAETRTTWWSILPVGRMMAQVRTSEQVLDGGLRLRQLHPVSRLLGGEYFGSGRFEDRGLPVVGDDVKSQVGAIILRCHPHKAPYDSGGAASRDSAQWRQQRLLTTFWSAALQSRRISKTERSVPARPRNGLTTNPHRPERLRAVAHEDRKVGAHPASRAAASATADNVELKIRGWDSPN